MADLSLAAATRAERGRHVHALRRDGKVPAVLYGHNREPLALVADAHDLERLWMRAGRTHLLDLKVDGGKATKVLIRDLQRDPRSARVIHADFLAVNLREKLTADIPLVTVGDAPAVTETKVGVLTQTVSTLRVECLPTDLPAQLNVDVSGLAEIDQAVHVRDLVLPEGVALLHADPDEVVVKVSALRLAVEEEEEAPAAEAEGEEGAAAEAPAAEGGESEEASSE